MGKRPKASADPQLRQLIAQTAARLMLEGGIRDFAMAKRKAAQRLGVGHTRNLPGNEEIELALLEYQRLFRSEGQSEVLFELRRTALEAMTMLEPFAPCLVGPIVNGSADENTPIYLHLFADTAEQVLIFLLERHIPFEQGERGVHLGNGQIVSFPKFSFFAGDIAIELTVFPAAGSRQPPLSPVDGKPMKRIDRHHLKSLLEETPSIQGF